MADEVKKQQVGNCEVFYTEPLVGTGILAPGMNYEPHVTRELERLIHPSVGFLDIGANVGVYQAIVKTWRGLAYATTAVEVNLDNVALLQRTIQHNGWLNTDLIPLCAWSEMAWKEGNRSWNTTVYHHRSSEARYLCVPLDMIPLKPFDIVKLDVEGCELQVLIGMNGLIHKYRPTFLFEFNTYILNENGVDPVDLLQKFLELGYKLTVLDYKPGMRAEFTDAKLCAKHVERFTPLCDIMAEHGNH
jgi:FkbM family methyltransferase